MEWFLTVQVAWEVATFVAWGVSEDESLAGSLSEILDLGLTYGGELLAFWMTWHLSRSHSLRVVAITATLCWLIMFVDRWLMDDYGFPLWYEIALLATPPLALATLYARARITRAVA